MKHRRVILTVMALLLAVLAAGLARLDPGGPRLDGRSLSEWIHRATEGPEDQRAQAIEAVLTLEGDGFPHLLRMLEVRDSVFKRALMRLLGATRAVRLGLHWAADQHETALLGFRALGPAGASAAKALVPMLSASETEPQALAALAAIGPEALPSLQAGLADPNPRVRAGAARAFALAPLRPRGLEAFEALRRLTLDPVPEVAAAARDTLKSLSTGATPSRQ